MAPFAARFQGMYSNFSQIASTLNESCPTTIGFKYLVRA